MNLQMKRKTCTFCGTSVTISHLTGRKYTSGKVLHLLAILTLHRNKTKNDGSIKENYAYYVYIMRKLTRSEISGLHHGVTELFVPLGCYAVSAGTCLPRFLGLLDP